MWEKDGYKCCGDEVGTGRNSAGRVGEGFKILGAVGDKMLTPCHCLISNHGTLHHYNSS